MAPSPARLGETPSAAPGDDPLGRCVRRNREAMGPELGRALAALQDDALLEDACGLDLAVRARAPERCASVRLSSLRETCAFRASIAAARPDACPPAPGLRGRDPVCVALASRNAALCAAASLTERTRCLALAVVLDIPWPWLIAGMVVALLAEAFKAGSRLRDDVEGLV